MSSIASTDSSSINEIKSTGVLFDSDPSMNLELFKYIKCEPTDSDTKKQCRGLVFHGDNLILKAFPYTTELHTEEQVREYFQTHDINNYDFQYAYEGTLIRAFFHSNTMKGRWYYSTHSKLDCTRSRWGSRKTFMEMLKQGLPNDFESMLDINKQYFFLVLTDSENRLVCDYDKISNEQPDFPKVLLVAVSENGARKNPHLDPLADYVNCPFNRDTMDVKTLCDICFDGFTDLTDMYQGVICFEKGTFNHCKVLFPKYSELLKVRGNEPSIMYRYLQLRMNPEMLQKLNNLYPLYTEAFENYEHILCDIAKDIHSSYRARFIQKQHVVVPQEEYQVMRSCHSWHLENKEKNKVSIERVMKQMNLQPPTNLNKMIRRYKTQQSEVNVVPRTQFPTPKVPPCTPDFCPVELSV